MSFRTRIVSAVLVMAFMGGLVWVAASGRTLGSDDGDGGSLFAPGRITINLWYADAALTDYLNEVAVAYNESQGRCRVEPSLRSGVEYLEAISRASVEADRDMPDVYVISNDALEKAVLAGLAAPVDDSGSFEDTETYPQTAIDAVTCHDAVCGYPFYFETAALLYNKEYVAAAQEAAEDAPEESGSSAELPSTILDIIRFAGGYDAPEGVTSVFTWDVGDIFYNYYFVGDMIDVGGPCGDDSSRIDIYNASAIRSLQVYQQLNQFFSIDTKSVSYESVLDDFIAGRLVFTVATSDAVRTIAAAKADGSFTGDYGVLRLPDISDDLQTRGLSVTNCLVVNGYSEEQAEANRFIRYLLYEKSGDFFPRTGKPLAQNGCRYPDEHMDGFFSAYADSVPISKMRATSNFWMLLENAFSEIWDGADPNAALKALYEQTMIQITGDGGFSVTALEDPEKIDINAELSGGE